MGRRRPTHPSDLRLKDTLSGIQHRPKFSRPNRPAAIWSDHKRVALFTVFNFKVGDRAKGEPVNDDVIQCTEPVINMSSCRPRQESRSILARTLRVGVNRHRATLLTQVLGHNFHYAAFSFGPHSFFSARQSCRAKLNARGAKLDRNH